MCRAARAGLLHVERSGRQGLRSRGFRCAVAESNHGMDCLETQKSDDRQERGDCRRLRRGALHHRAQTPEEDRAVLRKTLRGIRASSGTLGVGRGSPAAFLVAQVPPPDRLRANVPLHPTVAVAPFRAPCPFALRRTRPPPRRPRGKSPNTLRCSA